MTIKEVAENLNGRQYEGFFIEDEIIDECIVNDIVIVTGYSDDLVEFEGALACEKDAYDGNVFYISSAGGVFYEKHKHCKRLDAIWFNGGNPSWRFETDIPHETFEIMDGCETFCVGIVFSLEDV